MRRWLEVSIEVPSAAADALALRLVERGSLGLIEEAAGDRLRLRAHFEEPADERLAEDVRGWLRELEEFFPGCAASGVAVGRVDERDWAEGWKREFPPLEVGRSLRIRPPWIAPDDSTRHDVEIEPAMAFGTGHHASTLGCLLALEDVVEREGAPSRVLDVGTGSGILAIACARLGAREVVAVDVDTAAVDAARENARRNRVEHVVALRLGSLEAVRGRFPLIVANLYSGLLRRMFPALAERAAPRGTLVVAGFLDADAAAVAEAAHGWCEVARRSLDGWTTLMLRREG
jgi:ribosomal protein L11 methyltransferase